MSEISLNASMHSNLLSLQQTRKLQDMTQLRLSTGLKVNSAIDNPSSYYTASSLNNRAEDLSALLDAMSQGIQTIKAANEALETGTAILQQAKAAAAQYKPDYNPPKVDIGHLIEQQKQQRLAAVSSPVTLEKGWLLANGADYVVENEAELRDAALNAVAGETIVINGYINVTDDANINFADGVKLSGVENFDNRAVAADGGYQSKISVNSKAFLVLEGHNEVSGFELSSVAQYGLYVKGDANKIENLDISMNHNARSTAAIQNQGGLAIKNLNIMNNEQEHARGIMNNKELTVDGHLNIQTEGHWGHGIVSFQNSVTTIEASAKINIHTQGLVGVGLDQDRTALLDIKGGIINIVSDKSYAFLNEDYSPTTGGNTINIASGTKLNINANSIFLNNKKSGTVTNPTTGIAENIINIEEGVEIDFYDKVNKAQSRFVSNSSWSSHAVTESFKIGLNLETINAFTPQTSGEPAEKTQFSSILDQYNLLLNDASYKGINLLQQGNLKINFNEERSSGINIQGVDAKSEALGIREREWLNHIDVQASIQETDAAINQLRTYAAQFGNYFSIVSARQNFTENLINVLHEGADKLTLADMNEESANLLALQTRQQLAVNSLSLASQAAQSILKLF